jgi:hypothetical protein
MDIKEMNNKLNKLEELVLHMLNAPNNGSVKRYIDDIQRSKKEQEIKFVVGGVYKREDIFVFLAEVYDTNHKKFWMRDIKCSGGWFAGDKEEMKRVLKQGIYKYTGRTLLDILNKE